jgi:hypothetical protein
MVVVLAVPLVPVKLLHAFAAKLTPDPTVMVTLATPVVEPFEAAVIEPSAATVMLALV